MEAPDRAQLREGCYCQGAEVGPVSVAYLVGEFGNHRRGHDDLRAGHPGADDFQGVQRLVILVGEQDGEIGVNGDELWLLHRGRR